MVFLFQLVYHGAKSEMYLATLIQYAGIKLHKNALNKGFRTFAVYGSLYFFAYLAVGY